MICPEDVGCGDADGREEGGRTPVVTSVDAPPVLEFSEHVFDLVTLAIELFVVRDWRLAVRLGGDASSNALFSSVPGNQSASSFRSAGSAGACGKASIISAAPLKSLICPSLSNMTKWSAPAVTDSMELGVQAAFRASDRSGNSPFLRKDAAVRCALRWVASIIS